MHRWEDNIKMELRGVGWGEWTRSMWVKIRDMWRAVVNAVMNVLIYKMWGMP